jgi:hypothetical protein
MNPGRKRGERVHGDESPDGINAVPTPMLESVKPDIFPDSSIGQNRYYPFKPVPAMPCTIWRWKKRKTINTGMPPSTAVAMICA